MTICALTVKFDVPLLSDWADRDVIPSFTTPTDTRDKFSLLIFSQATHKSDSHGNLASPCPVLEPSW